MTNKTVTAWTLILAPLILVVGFASLGFTFDYPTILREPIAEVLTRFAAGGPLLIAQWYSMVFASLLFVPASLLFHQVIKDRPLAPVVTGFGVVAAVMNMLGFIRWPFLVPVLATQYGDPNLSEAARVSLETTFLAFHTYAGVGVGEHLGFTFLALWLVSGGLALRGTALPNWLGWFWIVTGIGTFLGVFEQVGWEMAGLINAAASFAGMIAVMLAGILVLRNKKFLPINSLHEQHRTV
jgi:Domain of unknown function (DUF4386)